MVQQRETDQRLELYYTTVKSWYIDMAQKGWEVVQSHLSEMQSANDVEQGSKEAAEPNTEVEE
ncbi:MAG: hypothetical protein GY809_06080 [Planctomycetes bacterium]|nr:hypothetical protein [Planctomycetota bacterium]